MESAFEKRGYLLEDFRMFHLRDPEGPKVGFHYHEFHKLVFLISGAGAYALEGRRYVLRPGDVVLVWRGAVHRPEIGGGAPYERVIMYISPEFLRANSSEECDLEACFSGAGGHVLRPGASEHARFGNLLNELERELNGQAYGCRLMGRALFLRLLVELNRGQRRDAFMLLPPVEPGDGKVFEILSYLNDHITEELSIDALAERFYVSKYHMMRRFRKETGFTIHGYLSDKRLLLARGLIVRGESATDACYRCGFRSYSAFLRAYIKLFGCSPTGRGLVEAGGIVVYE